jgi:hypothetical protein
MQFLNKPTGLGNLRFRKLVDDLLINQLLIIRKQKKENIFARSKNLTTKTEIVSSSFLRQIYRFGQRVKSHVGG